MKQFITTLQAEFEKNAIPRIAVEQKAYMRDQFEYYGIKADLRREIQRPFLMKQYLPVKKDVMSLIKALWAKPQRDYQYVAQELMFKYVRQLEKQDITLFEHMITHKSWWDTIDFIAPKLIAQYFKMYPEQREPYVDKWLASGNIWLQRSALLFQLKYKDQLDTKFLSYVIHSLLGSNEFFINKAIGWVLREYGKTDPEWVVEFANNTALSNLSRREALRLIN